MEEVSYGSILFLFYTEQLEKFIMTLTWEHVLYKIILQFSWHSFLCRIDTFDNSVVAVSFCKKKRSNEVFEPVLNINRVGSREMEATSSVCIFLKLYVSYNM